MVWPVEQFLASNRLSSVRYALISRPSLPLIFKTSTPTASNSTRGGRRSEDRKRDDDCWRCLIVFQRHYNVLQYKETQCGPRDSIENVCSRLEGDAQLITLFRATCLGEAKLEACPVQGPFKFTYTSFKGNCRSRTSSANACASNNNLQLRYTSCPDVPATEAKGSELDVIRHSCPPFQTLLYETFQEHRMRNLPGDETIECIGHWSISGQNYFAAKFQGEIRLENYSWSFRCFVYELQSFGGQMGISADSSCQELTHVDAATQQITFQTEQPPVPKCSFKHWLIGNRLSHQSYSWTSLNANDRTHRFVGSEWLTVESSESSIASGTQKNVTVRRCIKHTDFGLTQEYIVYAVDGCSNGYQCMKLRNHHQLVDVRYGTMTQDVEEACTADYFDENDGSILTDTFLVRNSKPQKCSVSPGKYRISQQCTRRASQSLESTPSAEALLFTSTEEENMMTVGCNAEHSLTIEVANCGGDQSPEERSNSYNCVGHWQQGDLHFQILTNAQTGAASCLAYSKSGNELTASFYLETACRLNQDATLTQNNVQKLNASRIETCMPKLAAFPFVSSKDGGAHPQFERRLSVILQLILFLVSLTSD